MTLSMPSLQICSQQSKQIDETCARQRPARVPTLLRENLTATLSRTVEAFRSPAAGAMQVRPSLSAST